MKHIIYNLIVLTLLLSIENTFAQCEEGANVWNESWTSCTLSPSPNTLRGDTHWLLYEFTEAQVIDELVIWNANKDCLLYTSPSPRDA